MCVYEIRDMFLIHDVMALSFTVVPLVLKIYLLVNRVAKSPGFACVILQTRLHQIFSEFSISRWSHPGSGIIYLTKIIVYRMVSPAPQSGQDEWFLDTLALQIDFV